MMEIRRIGVLSAAKVVGLVYLVLGLLFGLIFACSALVGLAADTEFGDISAGIGLVIGLCALPLFYAFIGAIGAAIFAVLYNLIAGQFGGIELQLESK
jgi:hypothetical protein